MSVMRMKTTIVWALVMATMICSCGTGKEKKRNINVDQLNIGLPAETEAGTLDSVTSDEFTIIYHYTVGKDYEKDLYEAVCKPYTESNAEAFIATYMGKDEEQIRQYIRQQVNIRFVYTFPSYKKTKDMVISTESMRKYLDNYKNSSGRTRAYLAIDNEIKNLEGQLPIEVDEGIRMTNCYRSSNTYIMEYTYDENIISYQAILQEQANLKKDHLENIRKVIDKETLGLYKEARITILFRYIGNRSAKPVDISISAKEY